MQPGQTDGGKGGGLPSVDLQWLRECTDGDDEALKAMVQLYAARTPPLLAKLENAAANKSAADVAAIAHACAGSSGACGMSKIMPLFRDLEQAAKAGNLAKADDLVLRIKTEFSVIKEFLRSTLSIE